MAELMQGAISPSLSRFQRSLSPSSSRDCNSVHIDCTISDHLEFKGRNRGQCAGYKQVNLGQLSTGDQVKILKGILGY
jgi:hypothetical protein